MQIPLSDDYAAILDAKFPGGYRKEFAIPTFGSLGLHGSIDKPCLYFCGNSLGLMPLSTEKAVQVELEAWKDRAVVSHFRHPTAENWVSIDDPIASLLAPIVGAKDNTEVAIMNTLTGNLHSMMCAFYKPTQSRYKILFEDKAFPSDTYAFQSQAQLHGYSKTDALIPLEPRNGENTLRLEDILSIIEKEGDSIALILFSGIQYYTGQLFDIEKITTAGQDKGCVVGWDLAHAVGNVPLKLHDWNVDFAVFCTYKYLNAGPGSIGGIFVHSQHSNDQRPRLAGWWGNNPINRFQMNKDFDPIPGASGFKMSNPSVLNTVCLSESLKIFEKAGGVPKLRERSISMTNYLYDLLTQSKFYVHTSKALETMDPKYTIITPAEPDSRGAQLSVLFLPSKSGNMQKVFKYIEAHGVIADERQPDVIRFAPNHLYNTHVEVLQVFKLVDEAMTQLK